MVLWAPYHFVVRRQIAKLSAAISIGNPEPLLATLAEPHEHIFIGWHALGGRRTTLASTRAWYGRLFRLLTDISFEIKRIAISGPPWRTATSAISGGWPASTASRRSTGCCWTWGFRRTSSTPPAVGSHSRPTRRWICDSTRAAAPPRPTW